ncbi:hypothetical protein [Sporolactobacillus nakayamae]|uniref:DUF3784 domain-containing protein n=1 Tax=Sporolactobacillus nakayamae TaxID=269670 RepID=A0A1I2V3G4_9BACL|nr:hypothetical protein [Sporolactobacillus nakayamae]SFG83720.1 hypothetical protein SAMN02982927_02936 [Sporolactobacillus nakayamae]
MTLAEEILRAFLLVLGLTELSLNGSYLVKRNGLTLARKQHGELPPHLPDRNIRVKVVVMGAFGLVFAIVSLSSYFLHTYVKAPIVISMFLFMIYGIGEALYYKY